MRFLVDECTGPVVARWLKSKGYDVVSVYDQAPGIADENVLAWAYSENRILITNDKDFGEKVYRERYPHRGVILLRLENERSHNKIDVIRKLLANHSDNLPDHFVVVTEERIRFSKKT